MKPRHQVRARGSEPAEAQPGEIARAVYAAAAAVVPTFDMGELMEAVGALQEGRRWNEAGDPARRFFLEIERHLLAG